MNRQDMQGVRSPTDIERKYDLTGMQKAVQNSVEGLNKTDAILNGFINATLGSLGEIEDQLDGSVMTYFECGAPSLESFPVSEWPEEEWEAHLGDWYYDKDTGQVFKFSKKGNGYEWAESRTNSVIEAMALANAAHDTADGKRRVFTNTPYPPYDNGDLWFNNQEIYVCQISKSEEEEYLKDDFIVATKYTDDTYAKQTADTLEVIRGTVSTIQQSMNSYKIEFDTTIQSVNEQREQLEELRKTTYEFGTEKLSIKKSGSEMKTDISEAGMKVFKGDNEVLVANNEGVEAVDLHAKTYLKIGRNSRFEDLGENRTACFWIGK